MRNGCFLLYGTLGKFAAALAGQQKAELVTGDPEFKPLAKEIKIIWPKEARKARALTLALSSAYVSAF